MSERLYYVRCEVEVCVVASDLEQAEARAALLVQIDGSIADVDAFGQEVAQVPKGWEGCLPYWGDGEATCEQWVERAKEETP